MSRSIAVAVCCLSLLAGVASANEPPPADGRPGATPAAPAEPAEPQPVKQVALDPSVAQPVCRRYAPTGSRISEERCEMPSADGKAREADREQIRRDLDEMRARQAMRDQARAQALSEALRRR